jgi:hypothetical protein
LAKEIQYITKIILTGVTVGIGVAVIIMTLEALFGRTFHWDQEMLQAFIYDVYFGLVLTIINAGFFDYLNYKVSWPSGKDYYRIIAGFVGSIPLTLFGAWLVRLTIAVGIENQSFDTFLKEQSFQSYLGTLIITFVVSLVFHAIFLYRKLQETKVKEQKIIAGNASAQFETLKNQIDPHFLFNSLNVLSSLIEENPENAQRFTTSLIQNISLCARSKGQRAGSFKRRIEFCKDVYEVADYAV